MSFPNPLHAKCALALSKSIQCETKGDLLTKLGRPEYARRNYETCLKYTERSLGKDHTLATELRNKLSSEQTGLRKADQRKSMNALAASLKQEKQGDYLVKVGRPQLAAQRYKGCLNVERRILGEGHPRVVGLESKYNATQQASDGETVADDASLGSWDD